MELEIENYTAESGFDDFYNRNMPRIRKNLKGRKMKKRHLKNAKALLDESTGLSEKVKEEIILDGIDETVRESDQESFEGEEFDHFTFANKIKKKAVAVKNQRVNAIKKRVLPQRRNRPVQSRTVQNGQLAAPSKVTQNISPEPAKQSSPQTQSSTPQPGGIQSDSEDIESPEPSKDSIAQETGAANITTSLVNKGKNLLAGLTSSKPPVASVPNVPVKNNKLKMIAIAAGVLIVAAIAIVYIRSKKA